MSTRWTLALIGVFAVLSGAYWLTAKVREAREVADFEAQHLFDFELADIVTLTVERAGELPVEAVRDGNGDWSITGPYDHIPANGAVWDRVGRSVASLRNERLIEARPEDLMVYDLAPPLLALIVGTRQGHLNQIMLGSLDPTQRHRYTRVGDGDVVLTPAGNFEEMNRSLLNLRERHLFELTEAGVTRLEFSLFWQGATGEEDGAERNPGLGDESVQIVFERESDSAWRMLKPVKAMAHREKVGALVTEVQFTVGRRYVDDPESLSDYGLRPPGAQLTVYSGSGGRAQTLLLGWADGNKEDGGIFVKMADNRSVFVIDGHLLTLLPTSPEAFRQNQLFSREARNLSRIHYRDSRTEYVLEHDAERGWSMTMPAVKDTDQRAVSSYLSFLKRTGAVRFAEEDEVLGLDEPRVVLEFEFINDEAPSRIVVGDLVPGAEVASYFARQDDGAAIVLSLPIVEAMRSDAFTFRNKRVFAFDVAAATVLEVRLEGRRLEFKKTGGRWVITVPEGKVLESQSDVEGILDSLSGLEVRGLADPAPSIEVQGVDNPILMARVRLVEEGQKREIGPLRLGNRKSSASRHRFMTLAGQDEIYYVDQGFLDDVRESIRGIFP